jgi:hypothetical protein
MIGRGEDEIWPFKVEILGCKRGWLDGPIFVHAPFSPELAGSVSKASPGNR